MLSSRMVVLASVMMMSKIIFSNTEALPKQTRYLSAIARAQGFMRSKSLHNDVGPLLLKYKLIPESVNEDDIPKYDAFSRLFAKKFTISDLAITRLVNSPVEVENKIIKNRGMLDNYFYRLPKANMSSLTDVWDDILVKMLYCDLTGLDKIDYAILKRLRDHQGGYFDTHHLLAIFFLEGNGCGDRSLLKKWKEEVVLDIIDALGNDDIFSDLYAERVACLYWAGAGHRVKREWIEKIVNAQNADGGWNDILAPESHSHPTGLAALSIKYFLAGNNKEYFYSNRF